MSTPNRRLLNERQDTAALTNPLDVIGSLRELYDVLANDSKVYSKSKFYSGSVIHPEHEDRIEKKQHISKQGRFFNSSLTYDSVGFRGLRFFHDGRINPQWESYHLAVLDDNFTIVSIQGRISRIGEQERQNLDLVTTHITPSSGNKIDTLRTVITHRLFPLVLEIVNIGGDAIFEGISNKSSTAAS